MQKLGIGYGRVDDQSFVLDSPFNQMTGTYAQAIVNFLEGNARQVILLLAKQQWDLVRPYLEPKVSCIMAYQYHTLGEKITELRQKDPKLNDFIYHVDGKSVKLIEELPKSGVHPYTKIFSI